MRKALFALFIAILLLNSPAVYGVTVEELQKQIADLQLQLQALQGSPATSTQGQLNLTFTLRLGSTDAATNGEVSKLQKFLAQDKTIYPEGLVTGYFGSLTQAAVQRWQAKNNIVSSGSPQTTGYGVVGPKTRNAIWMATVTIISVPPPATPTPTPPPAGGPTPPSASLGQITLSPSSGGVGETVTITGSGFTATDNDIHFGIGGVENATSFNSETMITFQVPSSISTCDMAVANAVACSGPKVAVTPGNYVVYVTNANGGTATTTFTVTSGTNYPAIVTVSPNTARVGDYITITGTGLDLTSNEIHLGIGGLKVDTLRRVKGTILSFIVPSTINSCDFTTGLPPCSGKSYQLVPGPYALYIVNASGKTNSITFTVIKY